MSQLAYVIYDARIVFTVDLEREVIADAEVYADSLSHVDTGLEREHSITESQRLHQRARALVEADPTTAKLVWTRDR